LEGRFGYLDVYCRDGDASLLTAALGERWEIMHVGLKLYPYNVGLRPAVRAMRSLMAEHAFTGADVAGIEIHCDHKVVSHHSIVEPAYVTQAQYSMPFCIALSLFRDPEDPDSFDDAVLRDAAVLGAARTVRLVPAPRGAADRRTRVIVRLAGGTELGRD